MCDLFEMKDNNITVIIIIRPYQPGSNIIIVYFKQITLAVAIITHNKRMG